MKIFQNDINLHDIATRARKAAFAGTLPLPLAILQENLQNAMKVTNSHCGLSSCVRLMPSWCPYLAAEGVAVSVYDELLTTDHPFKAILDFQEGKVWIVEVPISTTRRQPGNSHTLLGMHFDLMLTVAALLADSHRLVPLPLRLMIPGVPALNLPRLLLVRRRSRLRNGSLWSLRSATVKPALICAGRHSAGSLKQRQTRS